MKNTQKHEGVSIQVNGRQQSVQAVNVAGLVKELGLEGRMIAVERNLEVVPRSRYEQVMLADGDRIEIVHMIGGG